MEILIVNLLLGISFGFILFLLGTGLSLTMGLMRIVNLAHGALYMVGAYVGVSVAKFTGNFVLGILAGGICAGLLGLAMEIGALRRLFKQELAQVLLTIGLIYIFINICQWIWGPYPMSGDIPSILSGSIQLWHVTIPVFRLALIIIGLIFAIGLWLFQDKTQIGAVIRAGMDNKEMTTGLGINLKIVFTGVFALGTFIAGFCGLLGVPVLSINLSLGWDTLFLAVMVVMVGGVGSIQGALVGGLVIGLADSFGKAYFPEFAYFIMYLVLIIVLLFRPSGLLGRALGGMQQSSEELQVISSLNVEDVPAEKANLAAAQGKTRRAWLFSFGPYIIIGLALVLFGLPDVLPAYFLSMVTKILIFAIFAMSLNLLMGYTGLASLGHAAYFGLAGYTAGILMTRYGIDSFWVVMPLGILMAGIAAAIIGYMVLRVSGIAFLLVTFAFGQLLYIVAVKWRSMTGGTDGLANIPYPDLGIPGFTLTPLSFYYLVFIIFAICFLLLHRITNSSFGQTLVGIRENEPRTMALGYNTWVHKYVAFIIAGLFAGAAGVLLASFYGIVVPEHLGVITSTSAMLMVIIGSAGTLFGPVLGSVVIILLEHISSIYTPERWPLILGAIFVICVLFVRGGFVMYLARFWGKVSLKYGSTKS